MTDIITIQNVRGYEKDGTVYLNIEDTARGLGFTEVAASGNITIRWRTVRAYLESFNYKSVAGSCDEINAETYIPGNIFYRLAMKAKNEVAEKFQALVADEILPAIRKHGAYFTPKTFDEILKSPTHLMTLLKNWQEDREEKERLQEVVEIQNLQISEMTPKASYYDLILQSAEAIPISVIAKDYGMSGKAMNQLLHTLKIQYPMSGTWLVYQNYAKRGYTCTKTVSIREDYTKTYTNWTQKGRLFLYETLKQNGYLPLIEHAD